MQSKRGTLLATVALAIGLGPAAVLAGGSQPVPFADLDNDGVFGPGDVAIADLIANDGTFDTSQAEGKYTPPAGKVGIVVPGKFNLKFPALVLVASGDITLAGDLTAAGSDSVMILVSTGGAIHLAPGVKVSADSFVKLSAQGDVEVGAGASIRSRSRDDGTVVAIVSQGGAIDVATKTTLSANGLVQLATADDTGGSIRLGARTKVTSGGGSVEITAGLDLTLDGVKVTGPSVVIGSHSSAHNALGTAAATKGPGFAAVRNSAIKGGMNDGLVQLYADGGAGSVLDLTGTQIKVPSDQSLMLDAAHIIR